jgi:outer membrane protein assembly factor BamB
MKSRYLITYVLLVSLVTGCSGFKIRWVTPTPEGLSPSETSTPAQVAPTTPAPTTPAPTPVQPTHTPPPVPTALPPVPGKGALPAIWTEVDFAPAEGLNPLQVADVVIDGARNVAYVLSTCETSSLHEEEAAHPCISTLDLNTDLVINTAMTPGGAYSTGKLVLTGETLYLHHPWAGELYALDPETLAVREMTSDVFGIAYDGEDTTYAVNAQGLVRIGPGAPASPVERKYDDAPVAIAASAGRVYVLGYNAIQVFDADLAPVTTVELEDGQLRSMALDAERGRLYVGNYDGLYVLDTQTLAYAKTAAPIQGARNLALDASGTVLYALAHLRGDWYQATGVIAVDTDTWQTQTLLAANSGPLKAVAFDDTRSRLLVASTTDHALIPIDLRTGDVGPRLAIGLEVEEVIVDETSERLYVSDSAGWVHVLDRRTYDELGRVYGGRYISLDAANGRLYAGDERQPVVTAFDTVSLEVEGTLPQPGKPRANPAAGEVVVVNRRFYVLDSETGERRDDLEPGVGIPAEECPGCYYPTAVDIIIDVQRGLTATTTYMPWPGKPGAMRSIDYDPASGRAYYSLLTGGYVRFSSIAVYPDLGRLQQTLDSGYGIGQVGQPSRHLEGLSGYVKLDPIAQRLYVVRGRFMYVLDSETLARIGLVDAVDWIPAIAAVDSGLGRLYAPRGSKLVVWTRTGGAPPAPLPHETAVVTGTVESILPSPNFAEDETVLATIGGHLCRSTDGGETWLRLRGGLPELGQYVTTMNALFAPSYAQDRTIFYSAFVGETHGEGVYRSTDGGESWEMSSAGLYDLRVHRLLASPNYEQDGTLLAYANIAQGQAGYRSTDRGESWLLVTRQVERGKPPLPYPGELFSTPDERPQFRCDHNSLCERSTDGGATWSQLDTDTFEIGRLVAYALSPHFDQDHTAYWITRNGVYRYDDGAQKGELCTDSPLYGARDYTNSFRSIAAAATGETKHVLFVGSGAGEFLRFAPEELTWAQVWPAPARPTPIPPTPTPTPCAYQVDARFGIADGALPAAIGCAMGPVAESLFAFQPFELGLMFWHGEAEAIYVLQQDATWAEYQDTWDEGQPDRDPALVPPEGRYQPIRGFGKVWREFLGGVDAWVGWATAEERGFDTIVQPFAQGTLLKGINDVVYVLYDNGTWATIAPQ